MRNFAAVVMGAAALVLTFFDEGEREPETLNVRSLNLMDAKGRVRGTFGVEEDGEAALSLFSESGVETVRLMSTRTGAEASLSLKRSNGGKSVYLGTAEGIPLLSMWMSSGHLAMRLFAHYGAELLLYRLPGRVGVRITGGHDAANVRPEIYVADSPSGHGSGSPR